jgi:hypothetical protein
MVTCVGLLIPRPMLFLALFHFLSRALLSTPLRNKNNHLPHHPVTHARGLPTCQRAVQAANIRDRHERTHPRTETIALSGLIMCGSQDACVLRAQFSSRGMISLLLPFHNDTHCLLTIKTSCRFTTSSSCLCLLSTCPLLVTCSELPGNGQTRPARTTGPVLVSHI